MEDGVLIDGGGLDGLGVAHVAAHHLRPGGEFALQPGQVGLGAAPREVVEDGHGVPGAHEIGGQVAADKARAPGDENVHAVWLAPLSGEWPPAPRAALNWRRMASRYPGCSSAVISSASSPLSR